MSAGPIPAARVFTIPPGADFLGSLADALLADRLGVGIGDPRADPLALARATVFLPTRRAARVLRSEIADRLGHGSAILPVIRALGETDADDGFFEEATPVALETDPPIGHTDALLVLADLVDAFKKALPRAVLDRFDGQPLAVPASPADSVWLSRSLYDLIQTVEAEEVDFARLDGVVEGDLQQWWQITLEFLKIARHYWPAALAERHRSSPGLRHNRLIDAETGRIAGGAYSGPVIVAGSTGSRPSTARLIAAIGRHRRGAVVLPGLDQAMADEHWRMIAARAADIAGDPLGAVTIRSHPQYGLLRLLGHLGIDLSDVAAVPALCEAPALLAHRNRLVSLALLPPAATPVWSRPGILPEPETTEAAFRDVTLLEAANEREEAAALAACMRKALEPLPGRPEPTVALVTPDRNLARRVLVELGRYGIEANDSAGTPLASTDAGILARLVLDAAFAPGDPVAVAALLKHPLARFGLPAAEARSAGELVELLALRGGIGEADVGQLCALATARRDRRTDRHAPRWLARLGESDCERAIAYAAAVERAFRPLTDLAFRPLAGGDGPPDAAAFPVGVLAAATAAVLERVTEQGDGLPAPFWAEEAGRALAALLVDCRDTSAALAMNGADWIGAFEALLAGRQVKPEAGGHSRAFVWGVLEARLQHVDTMLLGGLNEGAWPAPGTEDPFLSRAMKAAVGLEPPERRIGQAAHDFQMAMGTGRVVLSRALRAGKSPTVASRWLQRLLAACGPAAQAMRGRGDAVLAFVRRRDRVGSEPPAVRPEPFPPADLQPVVYTFSEVATLRRDPYAIHARRILGLDPVDPFIAEPGPRERGTLYHAILEDFVRGAGAGDLTAERLMAVADRHFAEAGYPEEIRAMWRNRLARSAPHFVAFERERAASVRTRHLECRGSLVLPGGVTIRGTADRIDVLTDGTASLIDYKTGSTPSARVARTLLDPQLALEAHVLAEGGFPAIGPVEVGELLYLRLTGKEKFVDRIDNGPSGPDDPDTTAAGLAGRAAAELSALVAALLSGRRGYKSRVIIRSERDYTGDYDHLARVAEWQTVTEGPGNGDD